MRLSIVIATKDRAGYLDAALRSFARQIGAPAFEVVVVDNASRDATPQVVRSHAERAGFPIHYVSEAEPNRGKARNRGLVAASGEIVLFCDDDIVAPPGLLAAHDRAQHLGAAVVNGPILNVPSGDVRPKPTLANYSRAFLCTCNVSIPASALHAVRGFDESFDLYGWEDTELGVRLRESGLGWRFAWDAYIWHIKPPQDATLEVESRKAVEKARMAQRFLEKHPSRRARLATGAYTANVLRGRYLVPEPLLAIYAGVAKTNTLPKWLRDVARAQFLDGIYTRELARVLRD
jgi:glycosyltransferase involved in cell wall biosynthesis